MRSTTQKQIKEFFFIKNYPHLWQPKEAIRPIRSTISGQLDISVLGKLANNCISNDKSILVSKKELKTYWQGSLGPAIDFGLLWNPEIGSLYVVETLVPQFLNDMDVKALGAMSSGPYGILRGSGIPENEVASYLKLLNEEHILLLDRGNMHQLDNLKRQHEKPEKAK